MSSFSVSYIFSLVDKFTPGAGKLGAAAQAMSKAVHSAGAASNAAAAAIGRYGANAAKTASQLLAMNRAAVTSAATMKRSQGFFGRYQGGGGVLGAIGLLGGGMMGRNIINQAREASKAENKFRALVDSTTETQMGSLRESIFKQMGYTGEQYATLMDAAADAAQIVGNADLARGIMESASSLARIDTAKKDTGFFANALASVVGPGGTIEEVVRIADMMAKQQKLGAATAGGSIEAYKNVAALRTLTGFDPTAMFAAFGIMKNVNSAIKDGEMGTWAQYGMRMLALPNTMDQKKLKTAGLNSKMFNNEQGQFDIQKAHKILWDMKNSAGGEDVIKTLFSGRNVNAQKFWGILLDKSPEHFQKFMNDLVGSKGTLWQAVLERSKDLDGALTRLEGTSRQAGIGIGTWLAPAVTALALSASDALGSIGPMLTGFNESYPALSSMAQYAVMAAGGLVALAIPLAALSFVLSASGLGAGLAMAGRALLALSTIAIAPFVAGIGGAVASIARITALAYRFAGAAGVAAMAFRALGRAFAIGLAIEGLVLLYNNFEKIKGILANPMKLTIEFPKMPDWLKWVIGNADEQAKKSTPGSPEHGGGMFSDFMGKMFGSTTQPSPSDEWYAQMAGRISAFNLPPLPAPNPDRIPQAAAERVQIESTIRGEIAPLQVTATPITVHVTGQVNGPVTGTGSGSLSTNAPRGVSTSEAGSTSVSP